MKRLLPPGWTLRFEIGPASDFPEARNMAYTAVDRKGVVRVVMAQKLIDGPQSRLRAVIFHEAAHVYKMTRGIEHTEDETDRLAERLFRTSISYDAADVQTTRKGTHRRRPHWLPR